MAEYLEISVQSLNKYERGHRIPDAEILSRIANKLECKDPGWLLTGKTYENGCVVACDDELLNLCRKLKEIREYGEPYKTAIESNINCFEDTVKIRKELRNLRETQSAGPDGGIAQKPARHTAKKRQAG